MWGIYYGKSTACLISFVFFSLSSFYHHFLIQEGLGEQRMFCARLLLSLLNINITVCVGREGPALIWLNSEDNCILTWIDGMLIFRRKAANEKVRSLFGKVFNSHLRSAQHFGISLSSIHYNDLKHTNFIGEVFWNP